MSKDEEARANAKEADRIKAESWWWEQNNEFLRKRVRELEEAIARAKENK